MLSKLVQLFTCIEISFCSMVIINFQRKKNKSCTYTGASKFLKVVQETIT